MKNRFAVGDELELITPQGNRRFRLDAMHDLKGAATGVAPGSGHRVRIAIDTPDPEMALLATVPVR